MSNRPGYSREDVLREAETAADHEFVGYSNPECRNVCSLCGHFKQTHDWANLLRDYAALLARVEQLDDRVALLRDPVSATWLRAEVKHLRGTYDTRKCPTCGYVWLSQSASHCPNPSCGGTHD